MTTSLRPPREPLPTLVDDEAGRPPPSSRVANRAVLTQTGGLEVGRVCSIATAEVTLGRAPECTHVFDDASLSRVHARIRRQGDRHLFEDAGSSNGSFVNDMRAKPGWPVELGTGDRLRLGSTTLRFQLVDAEEEAALRRVYDSSVRDGLTGAFNRKHLEERLVAEVAFAARHRTPLSVVLLDVDHFKRINDEHGHLAGDDVLRTIVQRLRGVLRTEDLLARYGGEEIVVVARGIPLANAAVLAERLRQAVAVSPIPVAGSPTSLPVTVSAGVASLACSNEARPAALLAVADERLYRAKDAGRNRVVAG